MFSEILKIIPKIEASDLRRMEDALGGRFKKIAKSFGSGLKNVLMGGGIAGVGLAIIDKVLNPLKEVQEQFDKILGRSDDLDAMAEQFNTSSGKLLKLQALGEAKGVAPENLNLLLGKFQSAISEAMLDPTKPSSVRAFAKEGDTADLFFSFIQSMQKMSKADQNRVQQEVFGEKQILKNAEFFNTQDFGKLQSQLGLASADAYTSKISKGAQLSDFKDILTARRNVQELMGGLGRVDLNGVMGGDETERFKTEKMNEKLAYYDSIRRTDMAMQKILGLLEKGILEITKGITNVQGVKEVMKNIPTSKALRGINPFGEGK